MRFIRFSQLKEKKGITFTRQHIGRLQKAGKFPRSVPLGENTKPFIEEEIDEYLASRVAERDARQQQQRQEVPAAVDLDGNACGEVTAGEAQNAVAQIAGIVAVHEERTREHKAIRSAATKNKHRAEQKRTKGHKHHHSQPQTRRHPWPRCGGS